VIGTLLNGRSRDRGHAQPLDHVDRQVDRAGFGFVAEIFIFGSAANSLPPTQGVHAVNDVAGPPNHESYYLCQPNL